MFEGWFGSMARDKPPYQPHPEWTSCSEHTMVMSESLSCPVWHNYQSSQLFSHRIQYFWGVSIWEHWGVRHTHWTCHWCSLAGKWGPASHGTHSAPSFPSAWWCHPLALGKVNIWIVGYIYMQANKLPNKYIYYKLSNLHVNNIPEWHPTKTI